MNDDPNRIAAIEKAISKKYGAKAIQNPRQNWDESKEKEYAIQMKELYSKISSNEERSEKIDIDGLKVSKKLFNRESLRNCSVCSAFSKKSMDDVCFIKFDCCSECYIKFVEDREERWLNGWRPNT